MIAAAINRRFWQFIMLEANFPRIKIKANCSAGIEGHSLVDGAMRALLEYIFRIAQSKFLQPALIISIFVLATVLMPDVATAQDTSRRVRIHMPESLQRRVALVIGNSMYRSLNVLPNPVNDADDFAAVISSNGFEVIHGKNLGKEEMREAVSNFSRAAAEADIALFYFAGHGFQFNGDNFLMPIDGRPKDEHNINNEAIKVSEVTSALSRARGGGILILDACRDNPFSERLNRTSRSVGGGPARGLAPILKSKGLVVAYATQANYVAQDGIGRNSPFTKALVDQIKEPGLEIVTLLRRVARSVNMQTDGRQTPEISISLLSEFYINQSRNDIQEWLEIKNSDKIANFKKFMEKFPSSQFVDAASARILHLEGLKQLQALQRRVNLYQQEMERVGTENKNLASQVDIMRDGIAISKDDHRIRPVDNGRSKSDVSTYSFIMQHNFADSEEAIASRPYLALASGAPVPIRVFQNHLPTWKGVSTECAYYHHNRKWICEE